MNKLATEFTEELQALLEQRLPPTELEAKAILLRHKYGMPILGQDGKPLDPQPPPPEIEQ